MKSVVRGRASICHWNLEFRFYDKAQCTKFMELFMALDSKASLSYTVVMGNGVDPEEHWITIEDGVWAHNLVEIAKLVEQVDFEDTI